MIQYVDPHTKYQTEFVAVVGEELGIFNRSNQALLEDVVKMMSIGCIFWHWQIQKRWDKQRFVSYWQQWLRSSD